MTRRKSANDRNILRHVHEKVDIGVHGMHRNEIRRKLVDDRKKHASARGETEEDVQRSRLQDDFDMRRAKQPYRFD
mgnify:CR=1 FL=1